MKDVLWDFLSDFFVTIVSALINLNLSEEVLGLKKDKYKTLYYLICPCFIFFSNKPFVNVNFAAYTVWILVIQTVAYYICVKIFCKGRLLQPLLLVILSQAIVIVPQELLMLISNLFFNVTSVTYIQEWSPMWFLGGAGTLSAAYLLIRVTAALFKKTKPTFPKVQVIMLAVYDTFMITMAGYFWPNKKIMYGGNFSARNVSLWFFLAMIFIISAISIYFILHKKLLISKFDLFVSENKLNEQRRYMENIKEQEYQIRRIRHDFKNHVTTGLALMREGKIHDADNYFSEFLDSELTEARHYINTDYEALNAVVNRKIGECTDNNIKVSTAVSASLDNVAEMDLCIVLFNLFDNAIEASGKVSGDRLVKLDIFQKKSYLVVRIQNTVDGNVLADNPELKTTKKDNKNHGVGLNTIKDIVKRYNGIFETEEENNMFQVDVWLQNK